MQYLLSLSSFLHYLCPLSPACVTSLSCPATESGWSDRAPQNIYHPPLSPSRSVSGTSHSLSLTPSLTPLHTPSLSTQFLLDSESYSARVQRAAPLTHFLLPARTCRKRRGEQHFLSRPPFLPWISLPHHSALSCFLCLALRWSPSGFS